MRCFLALFLCCLFDWSAQGAPSYRPVKDFGPNGAGTKDDQQAITRSVRISGVDTAENPAGFEPKSLSLDAVR